MKKSLLALIFSCLALAPAAHAEMGIGGSVGALIDDDGDTSLLYGGHLRYKLSGDSSLDLSYRIWEDCATALTLEVCAGINPLLLRWVSGDTGFRWGLGGGTTAVYVKINGAKASVSHGTAVGIVGYGFNLGGLHAAIDFNYMYVFTDPASDLKAVDLQLTYMF